MCRLHFALADLEGILVRSLRVIHNGCSCVGKGIGTRFIALHSWDTFYRSHHPYVELNPEMQSNTPQMEYIPRVPVLTVAGVSSGDLG